MGDLSEMDYQYRKILVIGARKTGKTSILSTAVGGDFSKNYRPTARCSSFYDVQHMLELIDTPGLDDHLLNGTKDTEEPVDFEGVRSHYIDFRDDLVVQEMLTEPKEKGYKENLLIDVDITQIDAYLIVYTDDERSKRVAKALRLAILTKRMHDNRRAIFMLYHQGDFDNEPFITRVTINDETRQMDEEKNDPFVELVFRDDVLIQTKAYHHPSLKYLPNCSAQTGEGIHRTLSVLRQELNRMIGKHDGGAAVNNKKHPSGRHTIPPDLFSLPGDRDLGFNTNFSTPNKAGATGLTLPTTKMNGSSTDKKAQSRSRHPTPEDEEDDGAPISTKGKERAQCTSMAAAGCTIQ